MPARLYHLRLELYSREASAGPFTPGLTSAFVPPAKSDIFLDKLPAHRSVPWTQDILSKRPSGGAPLPTGPQTPEHRPQSAGQVDVVGDALLLPERNTALKEKPPHVPSSPKPSPKAASKDWRFGPVTIDSIDMEERKDGASVQQSANGSATKSAGGSHTKAVFVPSDTKSTDVGWGVVHLYKDTHETTDGVAHRLLARNNGTKEDEGLLDMDKCSTLCILAVPSWMMPSDLLGFVGDQTREDVSHFRLIRTGRANKYMVLMKFRSPKKARDWQRAWNGRLFSAMEPENCHVVFIKSVTFVTPDSTTSSFPENDTHDPFTTTSPASTTLTSTTKPHAPPTPSLIELPTCPVCLERMDSTTGLLTILCQHVFHCACLEKWRGTGCPVCRYTQSPSSTFPYPLPSSSSDGPLPPPECTVCATGSNLWICLICGNVGCGRYDSAHAYAHYEGTSHCYAMDIASQHVWDYAGDGYVHRLIQNKDVAAPSREVVHPNVGFRSEAGDSVPREKMEAMASEYTYLLTGQLEGQRRYFEEQVQRAVDKAAAAVGRAEESSKAVGELRGRLEDVEAEREGFEREVKNLSARLEKVGAKAEKFEGLARKNVEMVREEKMVNEGLLARIRKLEGDVKGKEEERGKLVVEVEELKELNRDLTMFVEGREQLRKMEKEGKVEGGEVEGGQVELAKKAGRKGKGRQR